MKRVSPSTIKAVVACSVFTVFAIIGWLYTGRSEFFPLLGYYTILIFNSFFSIRTFSAITPQNFVQTVFDVVLVGIYGALALSFGSMMYFTLISALLFTVASIKYMHLRKLVAPSALIERKIKVNECGALLSITTFCIAVAGWS